MELSSYLRHIFAEKIRNNYIKEKCELCDSEMELHLHHDSKKMKDMIEETLKVFDYPLKEAEDYTDNELINIKRYFIGYSYCIEYKTLCGKCHRKIHSDEFSDYRIFKKEKMQAKKNAEKMEKMRAKKEAENLKRIAILNDNINIKLDLEDLRPIISSLGFKKDQKGSIYKKLDDVIQLVNELGYDITYHEDKMYCWTRKYYLIKKI